jgi:hypothetical protein
LERQLGETRCGGSTPVIAVQVCADGGYLKSNNFILKITDKQIPKHLFSHRHTVGFVNDPVAPSARAPGPHTAQVTQACNAF